VRVPDVEPFDRIAVECVIAVNRLAVSRDIAEAMITRLLGLERLDRLELAGLRVLERRRRRLDFLAPRAGLGSRFWLARGIKFLGAVEDPGELGRVDRSVSRGATEELRELLLDQPIDRKRIFARFAGLADDDPIAFGIRFVAPMPPAELAVIAALQKRRQPNGRRRFALALKRILEDVARLGRDFGLEIVKAAISLLLDRFTVGIRETLGSPLEIYEAGLFLL
jgi:hypothetical protein